MNKEVLLHYSETPFTLEPRTYHQEVHFKPNGLWLSVGEDWKRWCESEDWGLGRLVTRYQVTLTDNARILQLSTPEDIDAFTVQFMWEHMDIDWPEVAARYQGIIIAPYQYTRRLAPNTTWYYPWDCASACIWDLAAIHSIEATA